MKKILSKAVLLSAMVGTLASCSPFIFIEDGGTIVPPSGGDVEIDVHEKYKGTTNTLFFALYNYYGIKDQHFTNKWLGMRDALLEHGIEVTNWEAQKDAKKFKIKRLENCDLPEDASIYMVNNQTWDIGLQYKKPLANKKPMAIISTCNGVEFASSAIKGSGLRTQNATIASFSELYHDAFENNTLSYLVTKYTAHVAPIFAACVNAVETGHALKNDDGTALSLSVENWAVTSIQEYEEMNKYDQYILDEEKGIHPTIRKANLDKFFEEGNPSYGANALSEWVGNSSFESIKELYTQNETVTDVKREGKKIKAGLLVPGSVNETVQAYIDYMRNYLADVYNVEMLTNESISSSNTQSVATQTLIDNGADFIISLQDDPERNHAVKVANDNKVFFGIAGTCSNPTDYRQTKDYEYFVGSIGTSIDEERRAAKEMTNYYLQEMIERGPVKGK